MKKFRGVFLKNANEIEKMRAANRIVAETLDAMAEAVKPGICTMELEEICVRACERYNVRPAFKGYGGFPFCLCCSVNEVVVHGFPSTERYLKEGDIVSCDFGVVLDGFFGDSARTFRVGQVNQTTEHLLDTTRIALEHAIEAMRPGATLTDVGRAVQSLAERNGLGVVRRFVGHGIGRSLHEKPEVPNFVAPGMSGLPLKEGLVIAIEPMLTLGDPDVEVLDDDWTAVTKDRSLSAHFEHSVAMTATGPDILSLP